MRRYNISLSIRPHFHATSIKPSLPKLGPYSHIPLPLTALP